MEVSQQGVTIKFGGRPQDIFLPLDEAVEKLGTAVEVAKVVQEDLAVREFGQKFGWDAEVIVR